MLVHYFSHAGNQTGYGRAADDYIAAMVLAGAKVANHRMAAALDAGAAREDVALYHGTPTQLAVISGRLAAKGRRAVKAVAMTTWETSFMPMALAQALNHFDGVIVPSRFCAEVIDRSRELLSEAPIARCHVVPHAFDPAYWDVVDRPEGPFTFYSIGAWGERKNLLGVLRAYLHAFDKADGVQLVLICANPDFDAVRATIARSALPQDKLPGLLVPDREFSAQDIVDIHRGGDCYVSAARGEGWGLGMFEAAVMQRVVVTCRFGGQTDFLVGLAEQYQAVDHQMTPVFGGEGEVAIGFDGVTVAKLKLPPGADARQLWAEPDLDQLSRRMRRVFEWGTRHVQRDYSCFENNRQDLEDRYSTPVVGQRLVSVLKEIVST